MAITERSRSDGTTAFIATYRFGGRGSKQGSLTFDNRPSAEAFIAAVRAHGAEKALSMHGLAPTSRGHSELTVAKWVRRHIDKLTGVEQYTVDKYEAYLSKDITPAFGDLPLAKLN